MSRFLTHGVVRDVIQVIYRCVLCYTGECGRSVCADEPCMHGGTCITDDSDFTCLCTDEYSGMLIIYSSAGFTPLS